MCLIWENKKSQDITPDQLRKGLRNSLFSEVTAVGLNGGEPTLRKDLGALAAVLYEELPKLHTVALITNGYKYEEVIERVRDVGTVVKRHNGLLDLMVSLDGVGSVHDRVRGKPGNFERAQRVLDFARQSDIVGNLRIGCTIIKENVCGLHDLLDFAIQRGIYIKYRLGIPHKRLYTQDLEAPYALLDEEKYHIAEFLEGLIQHYETHSTQLFFYRSLIDQLIHDAPRRAGCDWQHRGATITSRGELLYCAVQSKSLGTIDSDDSAHQYFSNQPHLQEILRTKCASCHHDYMGLPSKTQQLKALAGFALNASHTKSFIDAISGSMWLNALASRHKVRSRIRSLKHSCATPRITARTGAETRILICGWYGTETLGDKAILAGILRCLRKTFADLKCTLASLNPYISRETKRQMPELCDVDVVAIDEAIARAGHMDFVILGGGPLMAIDPLADVLAIFTTAHAARVPTIIAGCGLGPLGATHHNRLIGAILQNASIRIYRDAASKALAQRLGIDTSDDDVAEDPAFTWLADIRQEIIADGVHRTNTLLLGLREFPWQEYAREIPRREARRIAAAYEEAVATALLELVRQHADLTIRPLPMCTNHFGGDDRWFYRKLFRAYPALLPRVDMSLLSGELSPRLYCSAFQEARACIAMRYHSLIFALALGAPVISIDYTRGRGKTASLALQRSVTSCSIDRLDPAFLATHINQLLLEQGNTLSATPRFGDILTARVLALHRNRLLG